jgi:hypothetical protein
VVREVTCAEGRRWSGRETVGPACVDGGRRGRRARSPIADVLERLHDSRDSATSRPRRGATRRLRAAIVVYPVRTTTQTPCPAIRRAQDRALFVGEDGEPLTRQGWNTSWGRVMRNGVADGVITPAQRFGLHGRKHRGLS